MALDIRATASCSLGPLISANFADDYIQLNGLIKTQGSCIIKGIINPTFGQTVTFSYTKNGVTTTIPKTLRVLSFFADPFEGTTNVTLGCTLTFLSDLKEPVRWSQFDDPENEGQEPDEIVTLPIYASSVANECCAALGITPNRMPLTNKFSIEEFDFSSGYVQILSDLLVSEGYYGVMGPTNVLVISYLNEPISLAPVLSNNEIVSIGEINSGQLPGESVVVSYSSIKLNQPDPDPNNEEEDKDLVDWDYSKDIGAPQDYDLSAKDRDGNEYEIKWTYAPWSEEYVYYDLWDRVTKRTRYSYNIYADFASGFFTDQIANCFAGTSIYSIKNRGSGTYLTTETTIFTYKIAAPLKADDDKKNIKNKPDGYDEVIKEVSYTYEPAGKVHAGLQYNFVLYGDFAFTDFNQFVGSTIMTRYSEITYEKADITNKVYSGPGPGSTAAALTYPSNRVITKNWVAYGYTSRGSAYISKQTENDKRFNYLKFKATRLVYDGTSTQITTGRQIGLEERASDSSRALDKATDEDYDPNNGYSTGSQQGMELVYGSSTAKRRVEFSLPYAPDDTFTKTFIGYDEETGYPLYSFSSTASDAPTKARNFGRIQSRLLFGSRNGMNIQSTPENIPWQPFRKFTITVNGISGLYATNAVAWTLEPDGVLVSTDAMFWSAIGGSGTSWFPLPVGVASLPPAPTTTTLNPPILGGIANVYA